jgi:hypothetical protein
MAGMAFVALLTGCARMGMPGTEPAPLPQEDLAEVAAAIERHVAQGRRDIDLGDTGSVVVSETAVQASRERAARFELIERMRGLGWLEERPDGFCYIDRDEAWGELRRRQKDRYAYIVKEETDDRRATYVALREANEYARDALGVIRRAFYEARLNYLGAGHEYVDEQGQKRTVGR